MLVNKFILHNISQIHSLLVKISIMINEIIHGIGHSNFIG